LGAAQAEAALLELMLAGLVTNDDVAVVRRLLLGRDTPVEPAGQRLLPLDPRGRPRPRDLRAAKQRVRRRLEQEEARVRAGRWALLHRPGITGPQLPPDTQADRRARLLLLRHGVLTRAAVDRESVAWDWGTLIPVLARMELRGEIRRGYFVHGLPGPQFALPTAVEHLREVASRESTAHGPWDAQPIVLNACDPANVYGPPVAGRVPSTWLALDRGFPALVAADSGARLTSPEEAEPQEITRALTALLGRLRRAQTRTTVTEWNGTHASHSPWRGYLEAAGFYPDDPGMSWDGW
jgi:ATP-dependent Lhr-like helicase